MDQLRGRFSIADGHSVKKWHNKLGLGIIDLARTNAYATWKLAHKRECSKMRDSHRFFISGLVKDLLSTGWKRYDSGQTYVYGTQSESETFFSPSRTLSTSPTSSQRHPMNNLCAQVVSSLVYQSRDKRGCVVCRFEGRYATESTVICKTHQVCLCIKVYDSSPEAYHCSNTSFTCWQKFHTFYLPQGLYNANGNIVRNSSLAQLKKTLKKRIFDI